MSGRSIAIALALFAAGLAASLAVGYAGRPPAGPAAPDSSPARVIALAPNVAECVYALGYGERVVAVSDYSAYPPEAAAAERVGGTFNPNLERIIALDPDLVIVQGRHEKVAALCEQKGVAILHVEMNDIRSICDGLRAIGTALGDEAAGDAACAAMRRGLADVERRVSGMPRPKTLLCMNHRAGSLGEITTFGPRSFVSELLAIAGGEGIFPDAVADYPQVSKEALVMRAPEIIVELHPGRELSAEERSALTADWRDFPALPAVNSGRIRFLTDGCLLIPGPRIVLAARRLAEAVHGLPAGSLDGPVGGSPPEAERE